MKTWSEIEKGYEEGGCDEGGPGLPVVEEGCDEGGSARQQHEHYQWHQEYLVECRHP